MLLWLDPDQSLPHCARAARWPDHVKVIKERNLSKTDKELKLIPPELWVLWLNQQGHNSYQRWQIEVGHCSGFEAADLMGQTNYIKIWQKLGCMFDGLTRLYADTNTLCLSPTLRYKLQVSSLLLISYLLRRYDFCSIFTQILLTQYPNLKLLTCKCWKITSTFHKNVTPFPCCCNH